MTEPLVVRIADHPDKCPFHDLPPEQTVWVREPGMTLPFSAERACDQWHLGRTLRATFNAAAQRLHVGGAQT